MDYMDYFTNQLPKNLATMAALRDELAIRQGALSAAQDAVADRAKAAEELAAAKVAAAEMVAGAKDARAALKADQAQFKADRAAFDAAKTDNDAALAARADLLSRQEASCNANELRQATTAASLDARAADLASATQALEARVKAFQEKVAGLSA
jgi:hypothetical protein